MGWMLHRGVGSAWISLDPLPPPQLGWGDHCQCWYLWLPSASDSAHFAPCVYAQYA